MAGHPYNRLLIMNNLLLGWFACVHRCGMEVDYAHELGCHGNVP